MNNFSKAWILLLVLLMITGCHSGKKAFLFQPPQSSSVLAANTIQPKIESTDLVSTLSRHKAVLLNLYKPPSRAVRHKRAYTLALNQKTSNLNIQTLAHPVRIIRPALVTLNRPQHPTLKVNNSDALLFLLGTSLAVVAVILGLVIGGSTGLVIGGILFVIGALMIARGYVGSW